ncbi:MAG: HlyC/CorC family transporter [Candidatus Omnitrophica bacterium]|nr:HlyC/CorC family transporter [Candidatus Omnitrophota bacterium]
MQRFHIFFWPLVIMGIFFMISFFLSLSETALVALNRIKLRHLVNKGARNAKKVQRIVSHIDRMITTILVGNNIVNIGISAIGTAIFIYFFGQKWGMVISTAVVSFFILVFAEITPKLFASRHPEKVSLLVAGPISFLIAILRPVADVFMAMGSFFIKMFGGRPKARAPLITEEEIRVMIEVGREEGAVSDEERRMLHRIFEFGDTLVGEVMVPKEKIALIKINSTPEQLLDVLVEEGHSRIPVYKESVDEIAGIIYAKDLLHIWHNKGLVIIPDLVQPAYYVKKDKKVNEILKDFQRMKVQIAIVVDENNKTLGMVTLEDLVEEIVGEIEEEI